LRRTTWNIAVGVRPPSPALLPRKARPRSRLKDELGLDHFEGRTYPGWGHHTVLTAAAFTFLQLERRRSDETPRPTLPAVRAWLREIVTIQHFVGNDQPYNLALIQQP